MGLPLKIDRAQGAVASHLADLVSDKVSRATRVRVTSGCAYAEPEDGAWQQRGVQPHSAARAGPPWQRCILTDNPRRRRSATNRRQYFIWGVLEQCWRAGTVLRRNTVVKLGPGQRDQSAVHAGSLRHRMVLARD